MDVKPTPPAKQRSSDTWVKVAAYAAFAGAVAYPLQVVEYTIFTGQLKDPANAYLATTYEAIHELTVTAEWVLLLMVAFGLFRLVRPSSNRSKALLVIASIGMAMVIISQVLVAVGAEGNNLPFWQNEQEAGQVGVGIWLFFVNSQLQKSKTLSNGLTIVGMIFGVGLAYASISLLFNGKVPPVGALSFALGFFVWQIWLGVTLLRPLPA